MRALMIALGVLLATQAAAETVSTVRDAESRQVSYQGVDFSNPRAVESFYSRLRDSAREACAVEAPTNLRSTQASRACVTRILDQAVVKMQRPMLTARHGADTRTGYATGF